MYTSSRDALRIPRWVTVMDVFCLALVALIIRSLVGEGYRVSIGEAIRISLTSWARLAVWLGVLLALRHYAWRQIFWHTRVLGWFRAAARWEPLRAAWVPFAFSRLLVLIAASVAVSTIAFDPPRHERAVPNDFLDLYSRFDAAWYYRIAAVGYEDAARFDPKVQNTIAFFPGLPLLMRAVSALLDVNLWVAGVTIVIIAFPWGLTYVYRLARLDLPDSEARACLMLLAFYPFAMCYSAVLTESVFLLCAAGAFYHFRRHEDGPAAAFALVVGVLRPNGFLMSVPLALMAVLPFARSRGWLPGSDAERNGTWHRLATRLAIAGLPLLGMLCYAAYIDSVTGDPFAFVKAQQAWGRGKAELFNVVAVRSEMIANQGLSSYVRSFPIEILESAAALFALGAVVPIVRRFGLPYGIFVATAVLPPFVTMGSVSLGRYTAPLFPIFLWLAVVVPERRRIYWLIAFAWGQALLSTLFFTARPPH